jgi:hypothetical protein
MSDLISGCRGIAARHDGTVHWMHFGLEDVWRMALAAFDQRWWTLCCRQSSRAWEMVSTDADDVNCVECLSHWRG